MSVVARSSGRPSPAIRVAIPVLGALLLLLVVIAAGIASGAIPAIVIWIGGVLLANIAIVRFVVAATAVLLFTIPTAFVIIFLELKVIAFMNLRIGPNRIGPWGTLASVVHGLKVLSKEDFTPTGVDVSVFTLAPVVTFVASVMAFMVLPFGPGLFGADLNVGLLYFFAVGGLSVVGLLMAGWSSFNKYSLLGGLRSAAQMVSYEIPLTLSVVGVIMLAGTMSLNGIVQAQSGSFLDWFVVRQPLAFLVFFIAATAEANRTPFDLTEADSEIVAGFATEYSGMRFGFFFFAEYVNVFLLSGLAVVLFFGGWTAPIPWPWPVHFVADLGALGWGGVLAVIVLAPIVGSTLLALPMRMLRSRWPFWRAWIAGLALFTLLAIGALGIYLLINLQALLGIVWFFAKAYVFVFTFVWMRATLPRVRVDQLMGLAWKWLLPASLVNLFLTALAILVVHP
ncbi:MAG: complex I subunit 1/NuoH family protein [Candidatus Limnocylindrales bacterium]